MTSMERASSYDVSQMDFVIEHIFVDNHSVYCWADEDLVSCVAMDLVLGYLELITNTMKEIYE